jgi:hypothetical protein
MFIVLKLYSNTSTNPTRLLALLWYDHLLVAAA